MIIDLNANSKYINLGDWINYFTYGFYNNDSFQLIEYKKEIESKKQP
jgi:UDP-2,3-diacylglucosamine hydrolase